MFSLQPLRPWASVIFGALFFLLLLLAALTSAISLLEISVAWFVKRHQLSRRAATALSGSTCWAASLGTIFSFSHGQHLQISGITFYQAIDFITAAVMLPVGGLLIAFFTGWLLPARIMRDKLGWNTVAAWFCSWQSINRYLAPIAILLILLTSLGIL